MTLASTRLLSSCSAASPESLAVALAALPALAADRSAVAHRYLLRPACCREEVRHSDRTSCSCARGGPAAGLAVGVNDRRVAVGFYNDSKGSSHGYIYKITSHRFARVKVPGSSSVTARSPALARSRCSIPGGIRMAANVSVCSLGGSVPVTFPAYPRPTVTCRESTSRCSASLLGVPRESDRKRLTWTWTISAHTSSLAAGQTDENASRPPRDAKPD